MPGPLVVVPVVVGGAVVAQRLRHRAQRKEVLIVGPRDAGKTRLLALLTRGERATRGRGTPTEASAAQETVEFIRKSVRLKDRNWKVSYVDSPTDRVVDADVLRERLAEVDLGIFVVDACRLDSEQYRADAGLLAMGCRLNAPERTHWVLVMSHADRLEGPLAGEDELAAMLDDPRPELVDLTEWRSASRVVRRVVRELAG